MFNQSIDDRLSSWAQHRAHLNISETPLSDVWDFWKSAPFIPFNRKIDPYHRANWPSPWEIIVENKYDDFTKAVMIAWSIKLTNKFEKSKIEIKTLVDNQRSKQYNIVCVDEVWAINYSDTGPVTIDNIPVSLLLENVIEIAHVR
jgi:hypothetical protein